MDGSAIIDALGGDTAVAQLLGLKRSAVSMWKIDGIPAKHWLSISRLPVAKENGITIEALEASRNGRVAA